MTARPRPSDACEPVRLGALEQQVMDVLWDGGPLTIRQIIGRLPNEPAYTTIATVLGNLERKELVRAERDGRSVRHRARHTREEHAARWMGHALGTSRDRAASILHFVDAMPPGDVELLRVYLNRREGRGSARPTGDGSPAEADAPPADGPAESGAGPSPAGTARPGEAAHPGDRSGTGLPRAGGGRYRDGDRAP